MKKRIILAIILISFLILPALFFSAREAKAQNEESNLENLEDISKSIPITETGEIDDEALKDYKSNVEKRIEEINVWLNKFSWAEVIFGIKPKFSWAFVINLAILLLLIEIIFFPLPNSIGGDSIKITIRLAGFIILGAFVHFHIISGIAVNIAKWSSEQWWRGIIIAVFFIGAIIGIANLKELFASRIKRNELKRLPERVENIEKKVNETKGKRAVFTEDMAKTIQKIREERALEEEAEEEVRNTLAEG